MAQTILAPAHAGLQLLCTALGRCGEGTRGLAQHFTLASWSPVLVPICTGTAGPVGQPVGLRPAASPPSPIPGLHQSHPAWER